MGIFEKIKMIRGKAKLVIGTLVFSAFGATSFFYAGMLSDYDKLVTYRETESVFPLYIIGDTGTTKQSRAKEFAGTQKHVAIVGDVFYEAGLEKKNDPKFVTHFLNFFSKVDNVYLMIGNHDVATVGSPQRIMEQSSKYPNVHFPNHYYAFVYSDACLIMLDTNVYKGSVADKMWAFANRFVTEKKCQGKKMIAMGHHPLKSSGEHGDAGGTRKRKYEEHIVDKFDLFVAGHDHNLSDEGFYGKTRLVVSGSGAKLRQCKRNEIYCEAVNGLVKVNEDMSIEFITFPDSGEIDLHQEEMEQQDGE